MYNNENLKFKSHTHLNQLHLAMITVGWGSFWSIWIKNWWMTFAII